MKTQRRPFLVEVKRGTTRSAFTVKEPVPDIIRKAEAVLFHHAQAPSLPRQPQQVRPITGRILPSIVEDLPAPEPLTPQSYDAPKRRGRPIGSKNKPKTDVLPSRMAEGPSAATAGAPEGYLSEVEAQLAPKRRGRPPGSRNKPRNAPGQPTIPKGGYLPLSQTGAERNDHAITPTTDTIETQGAAETASPLSSEQTPTSGSTSQKRSRLRDRSKILSRYVYGTQPVLGQRDHKGKWSRSG